MAAELVWVVVTSGMVFLLGSAIGSFLNVVIYRIPQGISLLWPPSRCPHCLHRLAIQDNIPVFGWLALKGRCRYCAAPIAQRYPLVEASTGGLFLLIFWQFQDQWILMVGSWVFVAWLLALALIDFDTMTLPNPLTQSGLVVGLGFQAILGWQHTPSGSAVIHQLMLGVIGAVVGVWAFDLVREVASIALRREAMGRGDAKLAALLGAWLGVKLLALASFLACAIGALVGISAILFGRHQRQQPMPFGPFLALGATLALLWGEHWIAVYLDWWLVGSG